MLINEYIFIDTETTGVRPSVDRIIDIALFHVINNEIVSEWHQIINPEIHIPATIHNLTGISNEMVAIAPTFAEVADVIALKLNNNILVAHNARFDYAFLKNEMKRVGITFKAKTLCTLKLSRILFPRYKSHNLDAIATRFNLSNINRHRASGDAKLLIEFFNYLNQNFEESKLQNAIAQSIKEHSLPTYLPKNIISMLPTSMGVYMFYGENKSLLYIGKSKSLRDRILSHFASDHISGKKMQLAQQVRDIKWLNTVGELGALLKEAQLIKKYKPIFNRQLRRYKKLFCVKLIAEPNTYHRLQIITFNEVCVKNLNDTYGFFRQKSLAEAKLRELVKEHSLCPKLCGLEKSNKACFYYQIQRCKGACVEKESFSDYNLRLVSVLSKIQYRAWLYSGKIAIKETCQKTNNTDYHIVDEWCYLGTINNLNNISAIDDEHNKLDFDLDIYRLLVKYLLLKPAAIEIIELGKKN